MAQQASPNWKNHGDVDRAQPSSLSMDATTTLS